MYLEAKTATEAWDKLYEILSTQKLRQESRAGAVVGEIINSVTVIENPRKGIVLSKNRNMSMRYALGELLWYLSKSNKLSDIAPYGSFWKTITEDGETLNSAYGYRIFEKFGFDQMEHVKQLLTADSTSRQAVVHIKEPSNVPTKDTPCTVALQYLIRDGKLHATTYMRSNDIWLGWPYDVFSFTAFQVKLAMELGVEVGTYTHIAGSLHLYERNAKQLDVGGECPHV